ncbi:MAG: hypothetical protein HPY51_13970 [Candidatus Omnitrophica bacterium]|nr:hypothetical protein [Candidatus Omnitrophota bacterium]HPP02894.1 RAMP superfamily CRISPR-associated protein [bacterium]
MNKHTSELTTSDNVRPMAARWIITGEILLETAAHFGGEGDGSVDMTILRDAKDGGPLLPGTSLAGALRSHLADVLGGYRSPEHRDVTVLFGVARGDDNGSQSPLIVFDSLGFLPGGLAVEIRDGVGIDPATGTAEVHKKFDFEVLPAGTCFPLRVELIVEDLKQEARLLGLLIAALDGLTEGAIALGMRRSRGLGALKTRNWKAIRHNLTNNQGWLGWLTCDHENPIPSEVSSYSSAAEAIRSAYTTLEIKLPVDHRHRLLVDLDLALAGDLLVRSPASDAGAPDVVHLHSAGKPVLPGTSLAGVMRAQALRIARLVRERHDDGELWVDRLFGPRLEKKKEDSQKEQAEASRLRISESFIENGSARRQTRIAIDRFTGGVVQGALFDEEVQAGGRLHVRFELRKPEDSEIGLLLLLLKDLLSGNIPVGGASSVGRGFLEGTARIRLPDGNEYAINSGLAVDEKTRDHFNACIKAFHEAKPLKQREVRS